MLFSMLRVILNLVDKGNKCLTDGCFVLEMNEVRNYRQQQVVGVVDQRGYEHNACRSTESLKIKELFPSESRGHAGP